MMMKNKVTTTKVMVIDNGDDESDAGDIVFIRISTQLKQGSCKLLSQKLHLQSSVLLVYDIQVSGW